MREANIGFACMFGFILCLIALGLNCNLRHDHKQMPSQIIRLKIISNKDTLIVFRAVPYKYFITKK